MDTTLNQRIDDAIEAAEAERTLELREGASANQKKARALSLVVTHLETAQLWLTKAL